MYRLPQSLKDYKKVAKYQLEKTKRYKKRKKISDRNKNVVFESINDLYLKGDNAFDYYILCIDVYNKLSSFYSEWLKKRYTTLPAYELKLSYGDLRKLGTVTIVYKEERKENLILLTVDKGDGVIDTESLIQCLQKLNDIVDVGSKCLCNIYGESEICKVKLREGITQKLITQKITYNIHFFKETIQDYDIYEGFIMSYLRNRIDFTIFDEEFCEYLEEQDISERVINKLGFNIIKKHGKKKDKFDF